MTSYSIPLYQPDLSGNEKRYVLECLDSTWISSKGKFIGEFESRFADFLGVRHASGVCNGTTALHLAMVTLGIGPGDEIIVPSLTYIAPVNSILYTGATPVFADSRQDTWQIDPEDVRRKITPRTKGVLAVHLYGHPCDMDALTQIARDNNIFLIEDCAEAFGTLWKGRLVGGFGDLAVFSFFGNKTITTGEGGMLVTNDKTLHERAKHFKGQGLAAHREYWHDVVGFNYRMTNICAAIGLAQLERAGEFLAKKRLLAEWYKTELAGLPVEVHGEYEGARHSYWMVSILVENPADRDLLRAHLAARGIETRPLFYPVHTMPMHAARYQRHPVAENLAWRGINLPSWPGLSSTQVKRIAGVVRDFYTQRQTPAATRPQTSGPAPAPPAQTVCLPLAPEHTKPLAAFFDRLRAAGVDRFFHPHPLTPEAAASKACHQGKDFYCVMLDGASVAGYGMLRGWEEGYEIPSLGIALDPAYEGRGYGRLLMSFLHEAAARRGAAQVRVRVHPDNARAISLNRKFGYVFRGEERGQLVAVLELANSKEDARG